MTVPQDPSRRDIVHIATGAVAFGGVGALVYGLARGSGGPIQQRPEPTLFDVSKIPEGAQVKFALRGKPVFIRHRTPDEIMAANMQDIHTLPDPETDSARLRPRKDGTVDPRYLVIFGLCSHFSCVPVGESGDYDGWYCPCHGSHFDTAGRVRKGPAPTNMTVPDYMWSDDTTLEFPFPVSLLSDADVEAMGCPDEDHA